MITAREYPRGTKNPNFSILNIMQGDKNIIKFKGDHNSPRPQLYYDSVCNFFCNVLQPPETSSTCSSKMGKCYDLGDLKVGAGMNQVTFLFANNWCPNPNKGRPFH